MIFGLEEGLLLFPGGMNLRQVIEGFVGNVEKGGQGLKKGGPGVVRNNTKGGIAQGRDSA